MTLSSGDTTPSCTVFSFWAPRTPGSTVLIRTRGDCKHFYAAFSHYQSHGCCRFKKKCLHFAA